MENGIVLSKALTKFNTLNQGRLIGVENTGLSQTGKAVGACGMIYLSREEVEAERLAATLPNSATQVAELSNPSGGWDSVNHPDLARNAVGISVVDCKSTSDLTDIDYYKITGNDKDNNSSSQPQTFAAIQLKGDGSIATIIDDICSDDPLHRFKGTAIDDSITGGSRNDTIDAGNGDDSDNNGNVNES